MRADSFAWTAGCGAFVYCQLLVGWGRKSMRRCRRRVAVTLTNSASNASPSSRLHGLPTIDMNRGAVHVGRRSWSQHIEKLGDFVGRPEPVHRNLLDDFFSARRKNRGVDFARRNRIDADAQTPEIARHF